MEVQSIMVSPQSELKEEYGLERKTNRILGSGAMGHKQIIEEKSWLS
jgi:hypothetical protein